MEPKTSSDEEVSQWAFIDLKGKVVMWSIVADDVFTDSHSGAARITEFITKGGELIGMPRIHEHPETFHNRYYWQATFQNQPGEFVLFREPLVVNTKGVNEVPNLVADWNNNSAHSDVQNTI